MDNKTDQHSKKEVMFERMLEKKEEVKVVRKIVLYIALGLLLVFSITGFSIYRYISSGLQPLDPESEQLITVEIPIGSGLDKISKTLEAEGVIKNAKVFKYYAKFNNESQFQAGTYDLTKAMTFDELIKSLKTGKVYREPLFTVTIPEGLTIEQIAAIIDKKMGIPKEEFMNYVNDEATVDLMMAQYPMIITEEVKNPNIKYPLEGYLFPATYPFYEENPSLTEVVDLMIQATATNVTPYLEYLQENEKSVHWLLTFASLLEKEATAKADRETIASVFNNRLKEGMPLQTDPTVAYAHGEHLSTTYYKDLEIDDPYNTYKNQGLPPGPIAGAGISSITAVIDPATTNYLYFLADKDGVNHFTDSYEQHLKNRDLYLSGE